MTHPHKTSRRLGLALFIYSLSITAFAGWQVSKPESSVPREPFFQAGTQEKTTFKDSSYASHAFPNKYASLGQSAPVFAVSISGSIKENLERILSRYHWKVIWKAPYDYNFDGQITGASLPSVVEKLLQPFPLQAVMYMSNRTVAIVSRQRTQGV